MKTHVTHKRHDLRVVWLFPGFRRGGFWQPLLRDVSRVLPNSLVLTGEWNGFLPACEGQINVEIVGKAIWVNLTKTKSLYENTITILSPRIIPRLISTNPDVIVNNGFSFWALIAVVFKPFMKWRLIGLWEGSSPGTDKTHSHVRTVLRRLIARYTDVFVTNTRAGKTYLTKHLKLPYERVIVYPYEVVDITVFTGDDSYARADLEKAQSPVFLFIGQLIERKGLRLLMKAAQKLRYLTDKPFTLLVIGRGPLREELESLARETGLAENVIWVEWMDYVNLGGYYRRCDIMAFPTLEDSWGCAALECLAFGMPVLCSIYTGIAEIIVHGQNGYTFDPHDTDQLANFMLRFVEDPELRRKMRHRTKQMMKSMNTEASARFLADVIVSTVEGDAKSRVSVARA